MIVSRLPAWPRSRSFRRRVVAPAAALLVACGLSACGSAARSASAVGETCQQVGAVLSDGPDPSADPVGYAEAQIRPLRAIETSDAPLERAIARLASAYQTYWRADGAGASAKRAVATAATALDAYCPGVAAA